MAKTYGPKHGKIINALFKEEYTNDQRALYSFIDFISGGVQVLDTTLETSTGLTPTNGDAYYAAATGGDWTEKKLYVWRTGVTSGTNNTAVDAYWEEYDIPNMMEITDLGTGIKYIFRNNTLEALSGFQYNPTIANETGLTVSDAAGASYYSWQRTGNIVSIIGYTLVDIVNIEPVQPYFDVLYPISPDVDSWAVPLGHGLFDQLVSAEQVFPTVFIPSMNEATAGEQYFRIVVQNPIVCNTYIYYSLQYTISGNIPPWAP